jgi:hypothetical protein
MYTKNDPARRGSRAGFTACASLPNDLVNQPRERHQLDDLPLSEPPPDQAGISLLRESWFYVVGAIRNSNLGLTWNAD